MNDPTTQPVIKIEGLRTQFGRNVIHEGLDFSAGRGEIIGIVGGSGTGKSVLLRMITGLIRPAAGRITVLGEEVRPGTASMTRLARLWGVMFQGGALFSSMSVGENIALPLMEQYRLKLHLMQELVASKLSMVGLKAEVCSRYPSELSGGMIKRVAVARALILDPELLFLDEPTAGLDPIGAAEFDALIRELQQALGLTVLMVTHDLDSLVAITDRIAVLVDKKIIVATLEEHLKSDHPWIRSYFHGPRGRAARHQSGVA